MNKSQFFSTLIAISMVFVFSTSSFALLMTVNGEGMIVTAPADVDDDAATTYNGNNEPVQWGFDEMRDVMLTRDIMVDGGMIEEGTMVDSHMIFFNTVDNSLATSTATWTFEGEILGVMSDSGGQLEYATNDLFAAPGTNYPTPFGARGMEGNPLDGNTNDDYYVIGDGFNGMDMNELLVFMRVTEPGDWIRVITAAEPVPEPGTMVLLGLGLAGGAYLRRRRAHS